VAQSINSLALLAQNKGDLAAAEPLFRDALAIRRNVLGNPHPVVADSLNNLGNLIYMRGKYDESEALLREALDMRRKLLPADHPSIAESLHNLGSKLWTRRDFAGAEAHFREALDIWRRTLPPDHLRLAQAIEGVSAVLLPQDASQAESMLREALTIREANPMSADNTPARTLSMIGEALARQGKYQEAEPILLGAYEGLKDHWEPGPKKDTAIRLAWMYKQWNRPDEAAKWDAELSSLSKPIPAP
jgi:tetratricopeptide (TPR) repeat protein